MSVPGILCHASVWFVSLYTAPLDTFYILVIAFPFSISYSSSHDVALTVTVTVTVAMTVTVTLTVTRLNFHLSEIDDIMHVIIP
jgi:hypothetical protein